MSMKESIKKIKNVETKNVCLKCGKEWNEVLPFFVAPRKLFGICKECKKYG